MWNKGGNRINTNRLQHLLWDVCSLIFSRPSDDGDRGREVDAEQGYFLCSPLVSMSWWLISNAKKRVKRDDGSRCDLVHRASVKRSHNLINSWNFQSSHGKTRNNRINLTTRSSCINFVGFSNVTKSHCETFCLCYPNYATVEVTLQILLLRHTLNLICFK